MRKIRIRMKQGKKPSFDANRLIGTVERYKSRMGYYYDFYVEKKFSYQNLSMDEIIRHLVIFVSGLWQIHVFGEGNTRTTAVFFIKL